MVDPSLSIGKQETNGAEFILKIIGRSRRMKDMEKFPNIPPYEILEELGRGSTGIVFKARHKESGRLVAVKTICPKPGPEGAIRITRFHREARAMAVCNHPNIVLVYAIGDCAGQPYIIREFVEGRSLQAELDKELFTARLASKMVELLSRPV